MVKVACHDYGYDCDFILIAEIDEAVEKYNQHSEEEHGIEYVKEDLQQRFMELETSQYLNFRIKISKHFDKAIYFVLIVSIHNGKIRM